MNLTPVAGKRIVVMGLGRFGGQIAVARYLAESGADVLVTDASPAEKLESSLRQLDDLDLKYRLGEHDAQDFLRADLIVPSPAVPPTNPYLQGARTAGVPIITEIELSLERIRPARVIAVTGTKGKSTTTELLGRMLGTVSRTHVGGNIGRPLINRLSDIGRYDWVLLELSSYMLHQLGARQFRPDLALVTMVSADHLEWHGGHAPYVEAKRNIVRFQKPGDIAVLNRSDPGSAEFAEHTNARVVWYEPMSAPELPLQIPGAHNQLNAQGAFAAASELGVSWAAAAEALKDFKGLPHRLELVGELGGVQFFNDSIATVPEAAVAALVSFPPDRVLQIVGGYDKALDMSPMVSALRTHAKAALCIGSLGPRLTTAIGPKAHHTGDLASAIAKARELANPGDVILLSTGCASYDQFANFEERGDLFRSLALQAE